MNANLLIMDAEPQARFCCSERKSHAASKRIVRDTPMACQF